MRKILLPLLLALALVPLAQAAWCYQETATVATDCGGLGNGSYACSKTSWSSAYPCTNTYDGNWATYGIDDSLVAGSATVTINYSKPDGAKPTSLWQIKSDITANFTIPTDCWNYNPSYIQFQVVSAEAFLSGHANWTCWDGRRYAIIYTSSDSISGARVYEEAMYWDLPLLGIQGANVTELDNSRWNQLFTGNVSITPQAGNITLVTHPVTYQLTDRWALFYGNITGTINLTNGTSDIYNWQWAPADNGTVCVSTNDFFNFLSIKGANASEIDTAWGFASDASDNAVNTFKDISCEVSLPQSTAKADNRAKTGNETADDLFYTCPLKSPSETIVSSGQESKLAFCSPILASTGKNYLNESAHFELIVPTTYAVGSSGSEIYYFYADLK